MEILKLKKSSNHYYSVYFTDKLKKYIRFIYFIKNKIDINIVNLFRKIYPLLYDITLGAGVGDPSLVLVLTI